MISLASRTDCRPPRCWELMVCFGDECMSWSLAADRVAAVGGWRPALHESTARANATLKGDRVRNCLQCNATALARSPEYPDEVWNLAGGVDRFQDLPLRRAASMFQSGRRLGLIAAKKMMDMSDALPLLPAQTLNYHQFRTYPPKHKLPVVLPCSSSRGEDAAVLHSFFTDFETREPLRDGTFLEIGGVNGLTESNTWIFESCMGWEGILVEGHHRFFSSLRRHRPRSLNLRMAACPSFSGWVNYTASRDTTAGVLTTSGATFESDVTRRRSMQVECGNLGQRLERLGVHRLDFASIDVEGSELMVVKSLERPGLSLGVVLVEVRNDGQRPGILQHLLGRGMRYVGQIYARGTMINKVVDDCFVNVTHMRTFFPRSWALRGGA